jgi:uncharacterized protein YqjF (DUF2071 family)
MSETRRTEMDGVAVAVVQVRDRPRWTRTGASPHAAEIILSRAGAPYHRLVFTPAEWAAFTADVKAELYDLADDTETGARP